MNRGQMDPKEERLWCAGYKSYSFSKADPLLEKLRSFISSISILYHNQTKTKENSSSWSIAHKFCI